MSSFADKYQKIYNKRCFVKPRNSYRAYCSKCGHLIWQDYYNMHKHAAACHFSKSKDILDIYIENYNYVCGFQISADEERFILYIFTPVMKVVPGFTDKYQGAEWKKVYSCTFYVHEKRIKENGLYNIQHWKSLVDDMVCLNDQSHTERTLLSAWSEVFHIPCISSFSMAVDIYLNRGYKQHNLIPDSEAARILEKSPKLRPFEHYRISNYTDTELLKTLILTLEHIPGYSDPVLRIDACAGHPHNKVRMLFADDYFFTIDENRLVEDLLHHDMKFFCSEGVIETVNKLYPSFMLQSYIKNGGHNLLIPLLAPIYDSNLELLAKAGCSALCEAYFKNDVIRSHADKSGKNLKEKFQLPVKVLQKLTPEIVNQPLVYSRNYITLKTAFSKDPAFLDMPRITDSFLSFLRENVTCDTPRISGFANFSRKVQLRIARHSITLRGDYNMYRDYLNLSAQNRNYLAGYTPTREELWTVHYQALLSNHSSISAEKETLFAERVKDPDYVSLSSEYTEEDKKYFSKDNFTIITPTHAYDLYVESQLMHNCVRIYLDSVLNKRCNILFLRKKDAAYAPYVTIEVTSSDHRLVQCKAMYNQLPSKEVCEFVSKWARYKHVEINTDDISA